MSKRTRRILFYSFVFLFILVGSGVILYSQGWRINADSCSILQIFSCPIQIQKVGGVFIETKPKVVVIKIDKEIFPDKSGIMKSGTLIGNLLPKNYELSVEKDGYQSWQKNLQIKSGLVNEFLGIILVPQNLEPKTVSLPKTPDNFWLSPQQKIIFKSNGVMYYAGDSTSNVKLRGDKFIQWSDDGSKVLLQDSQSKIYYLYEIANLNKVLNVSAILNNLQKTAVSDMAFNPFESNKLVVEDKSGFYSLDINRLTLENLITESADKSIVAWTIKNPSIYYIQQAQDIKLKTKNYALVVFNLIVKGQSSYISLPETVGKFGISEIIALDNKVAVLDKNGGLYVFNRESQELKQIAHSAEEFVFSPDGKKIAFLDKNGKLNVYFLDDYLRGVNKKAGDVVSLNFYLKENGLTIKNFFWHKDADYLFVEYLDSKGKQKIDFIEIDDRLPINKYTLADGINNFYYDSKANRLYFIQQNNLYLLEF